jgi:hypothetical protein
LSVSSEAQAGGVDRARGLSMLSRPSPAPLCARPNARACQEPACACIQSKHNLSSLATSDTSSTTTGTRPTSSRSPSAWGTTTWATFTTTAETCRYYRIRTLFRAPPNKTWTQEDDTTPHPALVYRATDTPKPHVVCVVGRTRSSATCARVTTARRQSTS